MEAKRASKIDAQGHSLPNSSKEMSLLRTLENQTPDEVKQLPRPISSLSLKSKAHRCPLCKTEKLYYNFFKYIYDIHVY